MNRRVNRIAARVVSVQLSMEFFGTTLGFGCVLTFSQEPNKWGVGKRKRGSYLFALGLVDGVDLGLGSDGFDGWEIVFFFAALHFLPPSLSLSLSLSLRDYPKNSETVHRNSVEETKSSNVLIFYCSTLNK